ncbi:kinase-like protein [Lindgomyces ingoldianus]|uniref:Kinase-like protein n=1 Tax=Lindgomyces ingoldianus TaxID=673940 RepID=A0ACB6R6B0_9PLEO|nr:kinase-like protein [Lindgomyces ingoldianus]KAF2474368.1 kinase-like protein [Lindgomyces ingoldianus]
MDKKTNDLESRIKSLRRENADYRWFIPELLLREALSEDVVRKALLDVGAKPYHLDEIVKHVLTSGIKIFAVLVLTNQAAMTSKFIEEGEFQDHRLPFNLNTLDKQLSLPAAKDFYERQWEFTAPTFYRGTIHRLLNDRSVLPFTKDKRIGNGAFGTVYEIKLDQSHQKMEGAFQNRLVRKELDDAGSHRIELENLAILSHLRHPNILELLASYTYKGKHNLVFPLAEGGTLAELFASDRQTTRFKSNQAFFIALTRLSSAIEHVHNFVERRIDLNLIGCHYDLRPKNILVSRDTFLLADFGLSRFKQASESSGALFKEGAGDYRAPECEDIDDNLFPKFIVRRSSDIWSFGCIMAEAVTYMILGQDGVEEFRKVRSFKKGQGRYYLFHCGLGEPNEAVINWISQLEHKSPRECKMLLKLVRNMIAIDEEKRPRAKEVTAKLRLIAQHVVVDSVEQLFRVIPFGSSLDALIEQKRFQSWKYALGMLDQESVSDSTRDIYWEHESQFDSTLDCLYKIRDLLKSASSRKQSMAAFPHIPLSELNDRLDELLNERLQEKSRAYFRASMVEDEDNLFLQMVRDDVKGMSFPKEIRMRATLKYMTELAMQHHERDTYKRQLDVKSVKVGSAFGDHNIGRFQEGDLSHPVLVEWRWYGRQSSEKTINRELFVRVDAIADLLGQDKPKEFCTLDCRGFFHDPNQFAFGVVYDYPRATAPYQGNPQLKSLRKLVTETTASVKLHPTLDDKFRVAYILSRSILEFHLVAWLHKRLNSSNIAFFATTELLQDEWFQMPYVVGFNHSRPDEISAFTGGPEDSGTNRYQHPAYLNTTRRYCAEFDYYSLGIILLEIGLWRPLDEITRKYKGTHEQIRDKLLQERVPLLKQSMGRHYFEAVRVCIEGDFDQSELNDGHGGNTKSLHLSFERLVVSRLNQFSN